MKKITQVIFAMDNDKASNPNVFNAYFFKKACKLVGKNVIKAIKFFFAMGSLLRMVNCTIIAFILKCFNPLVARITSLFDVVISFTNVSQRFMQTNSS